MLSFAILVPEPNLGKKITACYNVTRYGNIL